MTIGGRDSIVGIVNSTLEFGMITSAEAIPAWTSLSEMSREDTLRSNEAEKPFAADYANRVIAHFKSLETLDVGNEGLPVTRYEHALQCATRAHRDGRDEEYVVCALLHDIGDLLGFYNHQDIAAAMLKPFVSEQNHWMVGHHALFQGYYFFHHLGADRNARDKYRDHPNFDYTAEFCEKYDQCAFDPAYESLPFEYFEPMLRKVFDKPVWAQPGEQSSGMEGQVATSAD
jgi:predicted HD phosphohydrolase